MPAHRIDDRFCLASVGRTYTALAVARLAERGLLDLDDPSGDWLPANVTERVPSSGGMSVRDLLSHTSGLADLQNDDDTRSDFLVMNPGRPWRDENAIPYIVDERCASSRPRASDTPTPTAFSPR